MFLLSFTFFDQKKRKSNFYLTALVDLHAKMIDRIMKKNHTTAQGLEKYHSLDFFLFSWNGALHANEGREVSGYFRN